MKTLIELANEGNEITLSAIKSKRAYISNNWQPFEYTLTDEDVENICDLLGGWHKTRNKVGYRLHSLSSIPYHWSFDRISFSKHTKSWHYCAGQDYPSELSTIRNWFTHL